MPITILIAAAFVAGGILLLSWSALSRRPLSGTQGAMGRKPTLEPRGQGLRFLGLTRNWLGLALLGIGSAILIGYAWPG